MKRFTHVKCKDDMIENGFVLFKKGEIYRISGFDYKSLIYYIEHDELGEFVISPTNKSFEFFTK